LRKRYILCIDMVFINIRTDLEVDDPRHSHVTKLQSSLPFLRDKKTKRMFLNRPGGDMQNSSVSVRSLDNDEDAK